MSFQPTLPMGGLAGWSLLTRTKARQEAAYSATPARKTEIAHFEKRFASISSAKDLVRDRTVLGVVLGAFGLQDDIQNRAFIQRVIETGTEGRSALSNRLADKRYAALASAMAHLAPGGSGVPPPDLSATIVGNHQSRSFEIAVGEQNQTFRLALSAERDLPAVLGSFTSDRARWFGILGNPPLRKVLETALGLPKEFAALPLEQQADRMQAAARQRFGASSVEALADPKTLGRVVQRFLVMSAVQAGVSAFSPALTLLSAAAGK